MAIAHGLARVTGAVRDVLMLDPRVSYALLFGSVARGAAHSGSDVDVAIGMTQPLDVHEMGGLVSRLESATGRGMVDFAAGDLDDLLSFCEQMARAAEPPG